MHIYFIFKFYDHTVFVIEIKEISIVDHLYYLLNIFK